MKKIQKICPVCSCEFEVPLCHQERFKTCSYKCGGIYKTKPTIINICKECNKEFVSKKYRRHVQDFCSKSCSSKNKIHPSYKSSIITCLGKSKIPRECKECKHTFLVFPSMIKIKDRAKYCSNKCRITHWNKTSLEREQPGAYRANAWKVYEKKCYDCGNIDKRVLVIHHIDGNRKNGQINNLIPVCHNCHCIRHIDMNGNGRIPSYRFNQK